MGGCSICAYGPLTFSPACRETMPSAACAAMISGPPVDTDPRGLVGVTTGFFNLLFRWPLATSEECAEHVGPLAGIPVFGQDALSSAAYGPEAALTLLIPLGLIGVQYIVPVSTAIVILLGIVYFSYRHTIEASRRQPPHRGHQHFLVSGKRVICARGRVLAIFPAKWPSLVGGSGTGCVNHWSPMKNLPLGLKPEVYSACLARLKSGPFTKPVI